MEKQPGKRGERLWRFLRDINIVGAVALGGAGVVLGSEILTALGVINAGQAGFFELVRRWSQKSKGGKVQLAPA